jgi:hypothetical protein
MRILEAQITDTQAEIGMALLPVLEDLLPVVSDLVAEFGDKLKVAVANVDWASFITSIVETISYFVENIETITRLATTLFLLNTAFNATKAAVGLFNVASVILGNTFVVTAGKIGLATGAVKLFRTALITTGIGALVVGLGFIIEAIINTNNAATNGRPQVGGYGEAIRKSGADAEWAAQKYGIAAGAAQGFNNVVSSIDLTSIPRTAASNRPLRGGQAEGVFSAQDVKLGNDKTGGKSVKKQVENIKKTLKREGTIATKEARLVSKGISEGLAEKIIGSSTPIKSANKVLARIKKNGEKAVSNLQTQFNKTKAGQAEIASIQAKNDAQDELNKQQDLADARQFESDQQAILNAERDRLNEQVRIYNSFADSVSSTFSKIKDDILGAFSLPQMGGSTDAIIRNMDKLLTRVKAFSGNITRLSSMGLDPKLLQQVINAGPIAGAKLAANLVAGGVGGLSAINRGYAELGNVAGEIGMTGTQALFGTQAQQTVYNVNINGGLDSGASIGKAVVDAVKAYERASGPVWQGA